MGRTRRARLYTALAVTVLAVTLFISGAQYLGLPIPSWNEIFSAVGIESELDTTPLSVHVIDVGQGDSILVKSGSNAMLVDAGSRGYDKTVTDYLKKAGVDKLDYVVATHPHEDHIGSLDKVIEKIKVGRIFMPQMPPGSTPTTKTYEDLLNAIAKKDLPVTRAVAGESFMLGDAKVTIVAPVKERDNANNMSAVLHIEFMKTSFLLMGDAEKQEERDILDSGALISADVIKVGHHGSNSSSTKEFLLKVKPTYALISVGKNNIYNHPSQDLLDRLNLLGIKYYRTDVNGTIVVGSDGKNIFITTEK